MFDMPSLASCIKSISPTFLKDRRLTDDKIVEKDETDPNSEGEKSGVDANSEGGKSGGDPDAAVAVEVTPSAVTVELPPEAVLPGAACAPVLWSEEVDSGDNKLTALSDPSEEDSVLQDVPSPAVLRRTYSHGVNEEQLHEMPPPEKFPGPDGWHPPLQPQTSRVHSWVSTLTRLTNVESSVNEMRFAQVDLEGLVDRFGSVLASLEEKVQRLDGNHGRFQNPRFGRAGGAFGRSGDPILGAPFSVWGDAPFTVDNTSPHEAGRGYTDSGWSQPNKGRGQGFRRGRRGRGGG